MMREKDDGGGRLLVTPLNISPVAAAAKTCAREQDEQAREADHPSEDREPARLLPFFSGTFTVAVVLLGGILTLYLYTQTVVLLGTILTYPDWIKYPALWLLILLVCIVAGAILRLVTSYYRLRRNRQIQFQDLERLNERELLEEVLSRKKEAKTHLQNYLRQFDFNDRRFEKSLLGVGMPEEDFHSLAQQRERLLAGDFEDTQRWLEEFRDSFQAVLDRAAEQVITRYMKQIGIATAAVPKGLFDSLIVTWGSINMLRELCEIYNLRLGRLGTFVLLGRTFRNVFIAGQVADVTNFLVQDLSDHIHSGIGVTADALGNIAASAGGKILGKASEGLVNALLIRRLGYGARNLLRPCR
jgi:uncharacterized membrane protein YcjF (UPF0283 family)